jgi:hypothetical protein
MSSLASAVQNPRRAAVLPDLFAAAPLNGLRTRAEVLEAFGHIELEVRPDYFRELLSCPERARPELLRTRGTTLHAFLASIERSSADPAPSESSDRRTPEVCVDQTTPGRLLRALPLPDDIDGDRADVTSHLYVAPARTLAQLHYDSDLRDVLLYQVFGRKRLIVVPPEGGELLQPVHDGSLRRTAGLLIWGLPQAARRKLLTVAGGQELLLSPGQTAYIPATAWHSLEYVDDAMSIGYRLGRTPTMRTLAELFPDPPIDVQALAWHLRGAIKTPGWLPGLQALVAANGGVHERALLELRERLGLLPAATTVNELRRRRKAQDDG